MGLAHTWAKFRNRSVWRDPVRRVRTLESFAETEEDGGKDLLAASRRILDPDLRQHIERHAADEERHASLFRERAATLRASTSLGGTREQELDQAFDLSRGRKGEVDVHGFYSASMCDDLGEVAYVAMLHAAECRARDVFLVHRDLNESDPETKAMFESILRDENYHVAYTGKFLDQWRAEGRAAEVKEALKTARSSRFMGAWKRLGVRSGAGFSEFVLLVMYWTVLLPFGLLARWSKPRPPVQDKLRRSGLGSQF